MKELLEQEDMPDIQERTVVKGVVVQVSRDEAYVDIGYKQEIPVSKRDLAVPAPDDAHDVVKVGDEIDVLTLLNTLGKTVEYIDKSAEFRFTFSDSAIDFGA